MTSLHSKRDKITYCETKNLSRVLADFDIMIAYNHLLLQLLCTLILECLEEQV